MWIEKMIIESIDDDGQISSVIIKDKNDEQMLVSERSRFDGENLPLGDRNPFDIIEGNIEIIPYRTRTPESYVKTGDVNELHIWWQYIPLKNNNSAVCYWLSLPVDAIIIEIRKISPKDKRNYAIYKDDELRKLWLKCSFSQEETRSLDFIIKYKKDTNKFDSYKDRNCVTSQV